MASSTSFPIRKDLLILPDIRTPVERAQEKKRIRRQMILNCLRKNPPYSRADITRTLGFNSQTVKSLVNDLVGEGLIVEEAGEADGRMGRPPTPCRLNKDAAFVLGVFIDSNEVSALGLDLEGDEIFSVSTAMDCLTGGAETVGALVGFLRDLLASNQSKSPPLAGIAIGVGEDHHLESTGRFDLLKPIPKSRLSDIVDGLEAEIGLPVLTLSRPRLQALTSFWFGEGQRFDSFAYLSFEQSPVATLIEDGHLKLGAYGKAGLLRSEEGGFWPQPRKRPTPKQLDPLADHLAELVATTANMWNAEAVVIGGRLVKWAALFEERFKDRLADLVPQDSMIRVEFPFCAAATADDAMGAATAVLHHIFYPMPVALEKVL